MNSKEGEPISWNEQELLSEFPAPKVLRLSLSGNDAQEIETLLAAITEAYLQQVVNKEKTDREDYLNWLKGVRAEWEGRLSKKREEFRAKARQAGAGDAPTVAFSHQVNIQRLANLNAALSRYQSELRQPET